MLDENEVKKMSQEYMQGRWIKGAKNVNPVEKINKPPARIVEMKTFTVFLSEN